MSSIATYTWQCPKCRSDNGESGTCDCGYRATKGELRYARHIATTERHFTRGLPALRTSELLVHALSVAFVLIACCLLVGLVPGATIVSLVPPSGSSGKLDKVNASVFSVQQSGFLHLVDTGIGERTYLSISGSFAPNTLVVSGQTYSLKTDKTKKAGASALIQPGTADAPSWQGWAVRTIDNAAISSISADSEAGPWVLSAGAGSTKKTIKGHLVPVDSPLGSVDWPPLALVGAILILALIGYATAGRASSRYLAATLPPVALTLIGLHWVNVLVVRLIGKYVATPGYPLAMVAILPAVAALGLLLITIVAFRFTNDRLWFLTRYPKVTLNVWITTKAIGVLGVPLTVCIIAANLDTALAALFPGLTL